MIARIAIWLGGKLLGKSAGLVGGLAAGALLAIAGLVLAFFVRGCVLDNQIDDLTTERNDALRDLGRCEEVNAGNQREIDDINAQAEANRAAAEAERARADRAAAEAANELEDADARHERELAALRDALAGDECAVRPVPADVDSLWRRESPGDRPR